MSNPFNTLELNERLQTAKVCAKIKGSNGTFSSDTTFRFSFK